MFNKPIGIAVGPSGQVYVEDSNSAVVQVFSGDGEFLDKLGGPTSQRSGGFFTSPRGIAVDDAGNVYVVGTANRRVQKF